MTTVGNVMATLVFMGSRFRGNDREAELQR
jgi:hypothetical protein